MIFLLSILLAISALVIVGCKKETEPAAQQATEPNTTFIADNGQTTCPVMGGPINKDIFVEYQGKKVYFCCAGCIEQFNKEPEKYLPKLPQFQN
ncbi:MAG TPA: hypothetical protein DDX75_03355 [Phycisphaerales bacterium]|nr:hypothetical protein [Phycisphaerales bacterium]